MGVKRKMGPMKKRHRGWLHDAARRLVFNVLRAAEAKACKDSDTNTPTLPNAQTPTRT